MRAKQVGGRKPHGLCKLTNRPGKFVDSHIIPESLTRPSVRGRPLIQYGSGRCPVRRWSSWYDPRLVIAEGEKYLSDLDSWAIAELRKHRLVWSGWGNAIDLDGYYTKIDGPIGMRRVNGIEPNKLRLFFLSLLWRAAATRLEEFSEISLLNAELEQLRMMILTGTTEPLSFYPCQLTQLSTKGVIHNHTPIRDIKYVPDLSGFSEKPLEQAMFRFYFDGLIAHMHIGPPACHDVHQLGDLLVGASNSILLSTVAFEESLQRIEMEAIIDEHGIP